jgi:hypothetical protein
MKISMQRYNPPAGFGSNWDQEPPAWAVNGGLKHHDGRVAMLAATGAIVQDLYHFPFFDKWYNGEKVWGLHDAAIKSGALWQVLWFIGLLEIPFLFKLANGLVDGTGELGFDPLGLKNDEEEFSMNQLNRSRTAASRRSPSAAFSSTTS